MRWIATLPLLLVAAACDVDNDSANDQMTLEYNQQQIEDAASDTANATREVASGIGNVAASTGDAIANEIGDIDVDVNVRRDQGSEATNGQ